MREVIQDCSAHRFEAVISAEVDGQTKRSKMKLCGTTGQSDSDWLRTLRDSAAKIAANQAMAKPMRDEMVKAINGEISMRTLLAVQPDTAPRAPGAKSGEFTLKPRGAPPGAARDNGLAAYSSLPPLPSPVSVAEETRQIASKPYVPPPPIVRPDLRLECFSTASVGEGPCVDFDRFTVIVVSARSRLEPGASLRFLRDGEQLAEVELGAMKKGQRRQVALPGPVCKGVNGGQLKIETMVVPKVAKAQAQIAESEGPYILRC
ncbi:MAG: hypothetical protein H0W71_09315 [Sphingomonas sp.]|nr:hypothetical protein [Sphingomonas sp.]